MNLYKQVFLKPCIAALLDPFVIVTRSKVPLLVPLEPLLGAPGVENLPEGLLSLYALIYDAKTVGY